MTRFLRTILGVAWGFVVGAGCVWLLSALLYEEVHFYDDWFKALVVWGVPVLSGAIAGLIDNEWFNAWIIFIVPILAVILVQIVIIMIAIIGGIILAWKNGDIFKVLFLMVIFGALGTPVGGVIIFIGRS